MLLHGERFRRSRDLDQLRGHAAKSERQQQILPVAPDWTDALCLADVREDMPDLRPPLSRLREHPFQPAQTVHHDAPSSRWCDRRSAISLLITSTMHGGGHTKRERDRRST